MQTYLLNIEIDGLELPFLIEYEVLQQSAAATNDTETMKVVSILDDNGAFEFMSEKDIVREIEYSIF